MADPAIETGRKPEEPMNIEQTYATVNAVKPEAAVTTLTFPEAAKAVRKMYRHLKGIPFKYPIVETSGNRYTWMMYGAFRINVEKGWDDLIHLFSHWYYRRNIGGSPHSKVHARLERKLRKWAVSKGWMNGALLKPEVEEVEPTKDEVRSELIERRMKQVARLERKIKALTTRMKKAKRSLAALERNQAKA